MDAVGTPTIVVAVALQRRDDAILLSMACQERHDRNYITKVSR